MNNTDVLRWKFCKDLFEDLEGLSFEIKSRNQYKYYLATIESVEDKECGSYTVYFFNKPEFTIWTKIRYSECYPVNLDFNENNKHMLPPFALARYEEIKKLNKHAVPICGKTGFDADDFVNMIWTMAITFKL